MTLAVDRVVKCELGSPVGVLYLWALRLAFLLPPNVRSPSP